MSDNTSPCDPSSKGGLLFALFINAGSDNHRSGTLQFVVISIDDIDFSSKWSGRSGHDNCFSGFARTGDKYNLAHAAPSGQETCTSGLPWTNDSDLHNQIPPNASLSTGARSGLLPAGAASRTAFLAIPTAIDRERTLRAHWRAAVPLTLQTVLPTSSATIRAPVRSSATPTGRP